MATRVNIIIDQEYFNIEAGTVPVVGYQPRAIVKASDVPYISQKDKLLINAIIETRLVWKMIQFDSRSSESIGIQ